ncbi:MAG TPA: hypothetical protein VEU95_15420, partial [Micropepsaceae bacterium]|nr:hypothetical protein [Micropepsaceae bacterium]
MRFLQRGAVRSRILEAEHLSAESASRTGNEEVIMSKHAPKIISNRVLVAGVLSSLLWTCVAS